MIQNNQNTIQKALPVGVKVRSTHRNSDMRGSLTEVFREEWWTKPFPIQWNFVESHANVFRGLRVHLRHHDYYLILKGRESLGFQDLRIASPTYGLSSLITVDADYCITAVSIPPGVAHGFYAHESTQTLEGVSEYFDMADEISCYWQDPELSIPWPCTNPIVSERDKNAPSFRSLLQKIEYWQPSAIVAEDTVS